MSKNHGQGSESLGGGGQDPSLGNNNHVRAEKVEARHPPVSNDTPLGVLSSKWEDKAERHRKSRCSRDVLLEDFRIIENETEQAVLKKIEAIVQRISKKGFPAHSTGETLIALEILAELRGKGE